MRKQMPIVGMYCFGYDQKNYANLFKKTAWNFVFFLSDVEPEFILLSEKIL